MRTFSIRYIILIALFGGILYSCNTSRQFNRDTVNTDDLYGSSATTDTATIASKPWRELFTETYLQKLIQEGLDNNPDQLIAIQRVYEAEAYLSQSRAAFLPGISASFSDNYLHNPESIYPDGPREVNSFQLGVSASWEIDLWGKLRSSKRAAYANLLASDAGQKAVQTRLISNIASTYYSLVGLDAKMAITRQTVKNNIDLFETIKVLKESGKVTGAAVVQSEANRYATEVTIPDLEQQIRETENALCLLLGRTPGTIERGKIDEQTLSPVLKTGIPAQLLDNRPDVMQAEFGVMNAFEITNNAHANFYPALTLTASAGFAATDLSQLIDAKTFAANVIGGLVQPLFNKKANITRLKVAQAQQEEALINFRNALLTAGQEVHNALGLYESSVQKIALRKLQLEALVKSVDFTKELLTYGSANYTEVLNAQTSLLSAQLNSVNDRLQQLNAVVSLYRALGGGWK
ncbi:MAG TPA: TolC family protein [Prolixibacteraceae bacterium]|jgi:NodT family efflux transporter outer membrane factor (OMF) lipoprotein